MASSAIQGSIFSLYWGCVNSLRDLFVHLQKKDGVPDKLQSAVGQLRVWAENVSAHRSGSQSLDYRLREATRFRGHVGDLLKDLHGVVKESKSL
jgi:hypothetical protein